MRGLVEIYLVGVDIPPVLATPSCEFGSLRMSLQAVRNYVGASFLADFFGETEFLAGIAAKCWATFAASW